MVVRFYKAECGDAASIEYVGDDDQYHYVFFDAGYERTYRNVLAKEIIDIKKSGTKIDLWIISHFHDDHIGGIIPYIKEITDNEADDIVCNWWYNLTDTPQLQKHKKKEISEAVSFNQHLQLSSYLLQTGKLNQFDIVAGSRSFNISGLSITVLSPSNGMLDQLRQKYKAMQAIDFHMVTVLSEPKSKEQNDYHKTIDSFNLATFTEDKAIENGSCISVLTELNGKRILWLADAFPSIICSSLRNLGFSELNPLEVDLVKIAHHGSRGNSSCELFSLIRCQKYLFSANGENVHNLPTKESLARILKNKYRPIERFCEFLFTYDNSTLRGIFEVDGPDIYTKWNFKTTYATSDKWVELSL